MQLAVAAFEALAAEGIPARVVSMPSWELFDRQDQGYRDSVLPAESDPPSSCVLDEKLGAAPPAGAAHDRWQERWVTISGYACPVREPTTAATMRLRAVLTLHRSRIGEVLDRYGATNPRLFGSVARGDADEDSDLDLLVDLTPGAGNELLRVCGLAEELSELLGVRVDVVAAPLLRDKVSVTALADAVAV